MTDNRTTELLRKLLDKRGLNCQTHYLHAFWWVGPKLYEAADNLDGTLTVGRLTPEQAVAVTLGNGTLTAEQVREAIEETKAELLESCEYVGDMGQRKSDVLKAFDKMEQTIADELNAELGSETCEIVAQTWEDRGGDEEDTYKYELSCGHAVRMLDCEPLHNCPRCGKAVKR